MKRIRIIAGEDEVLREIFVFLQEGLEHGYILKEKIWMGEHHKNVKKDEKVEDEV